MPIDEELPLDPWDPGGGIGGGDGGFNNLIKVTPSKLNITYDRDNRLTSGANSFIVASSYPFHIGNYLGGIHVDANGNTCYVSVDHDNLPSENGEYLYHITIEDNFNSIPAIVTVNLTIGGVITSPDPDPNPNPNDSFPPYIPLEGNRMITYEYAKENYKHFAYRDIPNSKRCMKKSDILSYLDADISRLNKYASNQLVPRIDAQVGYYAPNNIIRHLKGTNGNQNITYYVTAAKKGVFGFYFALFGMGSDVDVKIYIEDVQVYSWSASTDWREKTKQLTAYQTYNLDHKGFIRVEIDYRPPTGIDASYLFQYYVSSPTESYRYNFPAIAVPDILYIDNVTSGARFRDFGIFVIYGPTNNYVPIQVYNPPNAPIITRTGATGSAVVNSNIIAYYDMILEFQGNAPIHTIIHGYSLTIHGRTFPFSLRVVDRNDPLYLLS